MADSNSGSSVSLVRHGAKCSVCAHPQREEIDHAFVDWLSPSRIAKIYKLSRDSIYRHARATGLFARRQKNVRQALEKIIEQASEVKANANSIVAAVTAYARINAMGQWVERRETLNLKEMFDRMTRDELEAYARDGNLPRWFSAQSQLQETQNVSQLIDSKQKWIAESATNSNP